MWNDATLSVSLSELGSADEQVDTITKGQVDLWLN